MYSVLILLGSLFIASAEIHYGVLPHRYVGGYGYAADETPKPYQFAYQAEAIGGASARQETADGSGAVVGSYSLSDEDGRKRVVDYVADAAGFRASVKTNEPGTKNESPADVPTVSQAIDTPVAHVAPAAYSAAYRYNHHGAYGYPYGHNYGGLGYGNYYGGALGYGRGALGYGRGALGYGSGYYGGALGAHGLLGYGSYGGYRGLGYGGYHPYGHGYGHGYRYGRYY